MTIVTARPGISPEAEGDAEALLRAVKLQAEPERLRAALEAARELAGEHERLATYYRVVARLFSVSDGATAKQ